MWCSSQRHLPISERFSSHPVSPTWPSTLTPPLLGLLPSPAPLPAICGAREQAHRSRDAVPTILLTAASLSACCEAFLIKNDWAPFYSRTLYICPSSFMRIREDRVSHTRQESKEIFTQKCYEDFPAHLSSVIVIKVPLRLMESAIVRSPSDSSSGSD